MAGGEELFKGGLAQRGGQPRLRRGGPEAQERGEDAGMVRADGVEPFELAREPVDEPGVHDERGEDHRLADLLLDRRPRAGEERAARAGQGLGAGGWKRPPRRDPPRGGRSGKNSARRRRSISSP
jgi:hypothetical protein